MYTFATLRHNKKVDVDIPSAGALYKQYGFGTAAGDKYSGYEYLNPSSDKLDQAQFVQDEIKKMPESEPDSE